MFTHDATAPHPAGEAVFSFPTYGGNVRRCPTEDARTPFGGLVPWAASQKQCGPIEALTTTCPVTRTSPNAAPVYDVLTTFALSVLCDGRRFARVQRLREDPTLNQLFGLQGLVGDDTLRRFAATVPEGEGAAWVAQAARLGLLFYNLRHLFLRPLEPGRACGKRWRATVVSADRGAVGANRTAERRFRCVSAGSGGSSCRPATSGCARG